MEYTRGDSELDRFGGLPSHMPHNWPRCQGGHERMAFLGQIYACDWFPLDGLLCLQFYTCTQRCHVDIDFFHLELVHLGAPKNRRGEGVANPNLSPRTIHYYVVEDPIDQDTYFKVLRDHNHPCPDLESEHYHKDRLGGAFLFDGSEGPTNTVTNRCIGQFRHPCDSSTTIYLYSSRKEGFYIYRYY